MASQRTALTSTCLSDPLASSLQGIYQPFWTAQATLPIYVPVPCVVERPGSAPTMSQPLSPPAYDGLAYAQLHKLVSESESEPVDSQSPNKWFDLALRQAEAARQAERRNSNPGMYVAYTRLAIAYQKCRTHSRFKDAKAADPQWATRVNEFKTVRGESEQAPDRRHLTWHSVKPRS